MSFEVAFFQNITKKRVHTPISYEEEDPGKTKKISPTSWTMEVTSTRANNPLETDNIKSGCCADTGEECMKCDCSNKTDSDKPSVR
jgi:hypothetical protein